MTWPRMTREDREAAEACHYYPHGGGWAPPCYIAELRRRIAVAEAAPPPDPRRPAGWPARVSIRTVPKTTDVRKVTCQDCRRLLSEIVAQWK